MKLSEIMEKLNFKIIAGANALDREVSSGYVSDLLSDVIANARKGSIWLTLQAHPNIVAVAVMKGLSGIVLVNGRTPETETIEKAEIEGIPILGTSLSGYEAAGRLWDLGLRDNNYGDG